MAEQTKLLTTRGCYALWVICSSSEMCASPISYPMQGYEEAGAQMTCQGTHTHTQSMAIHLPDHVDHVAV